MNGLLIFLSTLCIVSNEAYKILLFSPKFGRSHVTFMGNLADLLVESGHDVTVFLAEMDTRITTNGTKLAKTIFMPMDSKVAKFFEHSEFERQMWTGSTSGLFTILELTNKMGQLFAEVCENVNNNKELINILTLQKFDLVLTEMFDPCYLGLVKVLNIPAHMIVSPSVLLDGLAVALGSPIFPSYMPSLFSSYGDEMNYFERLNNAFFTIGSMWFTNSLVSREQKVYDKLYGENFVDLMEIAAETSFVAVNVEPLLDFPRPIVRKIVEVGGLSVPKLEPLNTHWSEIMAKADKVVLLSFGSVAQSSLMPDEMKFSILETFASFPNITFIWKYEKDEDEIAKNYENIYTGKWLPQNDLLAHPKMAAFITHGGANSIIETTIRGVPVIAIPLFADQNRNAKMLARSEIGLTVQIQELATEKLGLTISEVLNNPKYKENSKRLALMISKRPVSPKELFVRSVEFAAEFGKLPFLNSVGGKMSFFTLYFLDIIIPLLVIVLIILCLLAIMIKRLMKRFICGSLCKCNTEKLKKQ